MDRVMTINVYDLLDNKIKAEFKKKDELNADLREQLYRVRIENRELKDKYRDIERKYLKLSENDSLNKDIINNIKNRLSEVESIKDKFEIINYYLTVILGLKEKYAIPTFLIDDSGVKMIYYLFYVYNDDKEIVCKFLLSVMDSRYRDSIVLASSYVVPQKVGKQELINLIKNQPFYTNGGHCAWNSFCFPKNPPYSEYMKNPLILDNEVFKCLCDNICNKSEGREFSKITEYQNLNEEQIEMLGNGIVRKNDKECVKYFFAKNHKNISVSLQKRILDIIGYSANRYDASYIFNYNDEVVEEILSLLNIDDFVKIYNSILNDRKKLLSMYFKVKGLCI